MEYLPNVNNRLFTSFNISDGLLLISGPLTLGTMQNVQELSQPICIVTKT